MLTISKINSFEELLKLENEWNTMLEKSHTNTIFLTFEWITNWWKCFGDDKKLFVLLVKEEGTIIGIAPLMITTIKRFGITTNKVEFIGMPLSDYSDLIVSEKSAEVLEKIYNYLLENKKEWSFVKLDRIPEKSSTLDLSKEILKSKKLSKFLLSDKYLSFVFDDTWETYKNEINSKKMKERIRYFTNRGELLLSRCDNNSVEAKELLNIFFEQHKERWNKTNIPSMFNEESYKKFFEHLVTSLLKKGQIDLFYLSFNKKPIAFDIDFFYDNRCLAYTSSYDINYAKQSPGKILTNYLLEYCASNNLKEYNFLRGGEKYKLKYVNKTTKNIGISIHKNILLYILDVLSNKAEHKIKENEILYNFFIKYEKKLRIF